MTGLADALRWNGDARRSGPLVALCGLLAFQ